MLEKMVASISVVIPQGLLNPAKSYPCAVPTGLRSAFVDIAFPTLNHPNDEDLSLGTPVKARG